MQEDKPAVSILIVDDDAALLQALPQVVHLRMPAIQVDICDTATYALTLIEENDYDAIVSDVKMPGMDGLELLRQIQLRRAETPVLLITGHGDHDLAIKALRGGAYDYILKPIDRDAFMAALQRAIQTHQLRRTVKEQQLALALHAKTLERLVEKRTSELVTANATKDKFIRIVAHELNMPLRSLKSTAQHMRHQLEQGEMATITQGLLDMERSISRTEVLTHDLLDTSLIETNMFLLHRERCDLVEVCRSLLSEYTAGLTHTLICEFTGDPIEVVVDKNRISQVLINLLSNARKYSPKGSPITVSVIKSGYEVVLAVRDTGVGVLQEAQPHIFEQFYRAPGAEVQTGTRQGLGLGLYISRKIVERHGGTIEVQSEPGQGSTFSVVLPMYVDASDAYTNAVEATPHTQAVWTITKN